jgi:ubiquinone/menaquinone biosynthesis C-methylase UbiE
MRSELQYIYQNRFKGQLASRNQIWKILCQNYFQRFIDEKNDTVLDIAAGYGEFINNIHAKNRVAVDLNRDSGKYVNTEVEFIISDCLKIETLKDSSVDKIFISNLLEHLNSTDDVLAVLRESYRILKPGGRILVLQPNIFYIKERYWFYIDHKTPLTHRSLVEALEITGFRIFLLKKKFLPYSMKSGLPQSKVFICLYLKLPILQWLFGKQTFVIGIKDN